MLKENAIRLKFEAVSEKSKEAEGLFLGSLSFLTNSNFQVQQRNFPKKFQIWSEQK